MKLKVMSFDIECLPSEGQMPKPESCPILMISCTFNDGVKKVLVLGKDNGDDNYDNIEVEVFNDETDMLRRFFNYVRESDVITGYNINGFDIPYIVDRCKVLGMRGVGIYYTKHISKGMSTAKIGGLTGKIVFDVLYLLRREDASNTFKGVYNLKSLRLEHVAKEILGMEKLEFSVNENINYWNSGFMEGREKFIRYCLRDSEIGLMFVQKFRLLDRFIMLSKRSGKLIQDIVNSMGSGLMVESLMMRGFKAEGRAFPCRSRDERGDEDENELMGAFILEPKIGVIDNVCSCDYKGLYPSLMIKHNICVSTLVREMNEDGVNYHALDNGEVYAGFIDKKIYVGIVPRILEGLMKERQDLKGKMKMSEIGSSEYLIYDSMQNAVKILLNSFYGYFGDANAKLYNIFVATAITDNGRKQIKGTIDIIEREISGSIGVKFEAVMGDTDSVYIRVIGSGDVVKDVKYAIGYINERLEKPMELAFENYISRIIIVAKKRYAMIIGDRVVQKGLETVRRDWCDFCTDCMDNVIRVILTEKDVNVGVNKAVKIVRGEIKRLKEGNVELEKLTLSNKLSKPMTYYCTKEPHVIVAQKMQKRGESVNIGDRIQYIVCDDGGSGKKINEKSESYDYVVMNKMKPDFEYYSHNQLVVPVMRILKVFGVSERQLTEDRLQKTLLGWI